MTMEQQTALKSSLEYIREVLCEIAEKIKQAFEKLKELLAKCFGISETPKISIKNFQTYPHTYPQNVNNLKVNIKGFPPPTLRCARSRC